MWSPCSHKTRALAATAVARRGHTIKDSRLLCYTLADMENCVLDTSGYAARVVGEGVCHSSHLGLESRTEPGGPGHGADPPAVLIELKQYVCL